MKSVNIASSGYACPAKKESSGAASTMYQVGKLQDLLDEKCGILNRLVCKCSTSMVSAVNSGEWRKTSFYSSVGAHGDAVRSHHTNYRSQKVTTKAEAHRTGEHRLSILYLFWGAREYDSLNFTHRCQRVMSDWRIHCVQRVRDVRRIKQKEWYPQKMKGNVSLEY